MFVIYLSIFSIDFSFGFFFFLFLCPLTSTLFPYTTLFRSIGFGLLQPRSKRRHFPRGDDSSPRPCVQFDLAIGRERQALNTGKNQYRIRNPDLLDCPSVDEIKIEAGVENLRNCLAT